jgi:hypothetical protein
MPSQPCTSKIPVVNVTRSTTARFDASPRSTMAMSVMLPFRVPATGVELLSVIRLLISAGVNANFHRAKVLPDHTQSS